MAFEVCDFLSETFLFSGVEKVDIVGMLEEITPDVKDYPAGAEIYSPQLYEHKLGFVVDGECSVERIKNDGSAVPLNTLKRGNSFGIVAVLSSEDEFPTRIVSKRKTKILFISKPDTLKLIQKYSAVSMNVIRFLAGKIDFLNQKIATFSSDTVEDKLANFLLIEYKKRGSNEFLFNCKKTAEAINAGRASLYRAISALSEAEIIKLENKKIIILDPQGLERKTK